MKGVFELVVVPENPLASSPYPPRVLVEADSEEQVRAWFKEAQEAGQYAGHKVNSVRKAQG